MNLGALVSETRNPATMGLDEMSTLDMVRCFNQEDRKVPEAIEKVLPAIAQAVDLAAAALKAGGRLIYLGAGTSGRLGVLDASECPPTFGVPHGVVVGLIAGGPGALLKAVEGAEDDEALGEADLRALNLTAVDMVVGLAASGRTPYVIGALRYARGLGCPTAAISCNPDSPIAHEAQVAISPACNSVMTSLSSMLLSSGSTNSAAPTLNSSAAAARMPQLTFEKSCRLSICPLSIIMHLPINVRRYAGEPRWAADVVPGIMFCRGVHALSIRGTVVAYMGFFLKDVGQNRILRG